MADFVPVVVVLFFAGVFGAPEAVDCDGLDCAGFAAAPEEESCAAQEATSRIAAMKEKKVAVSVLGIGIIVPLRGRWRQTAKGNELHSA